jgi:tRNA A-37 threonylcarbamoyl transferase component Bud32
MPLIQTAWHLVAANRSRRSKLLGPDRGAKASPDNPRMVSRSPTTPASVCPDEDALAACVEGTLGAERARALETHVDACVSCYQLLATYARAFASKDAEPKERAASSDESSRSVSHGKLVERLQRSRPLAEGTLVGRYVVLQWIGEGGAGVVYAAHDPELDRRIALKLMQPKPAALDPDFVRKKLLREARAMAKLAHPHVVGVYDVGTFGDQVFIAMEFVDGPTLRTWVRDAAPSQNDVLAAFLNAGQGLAAAHAAGLVHRDFKPENVLLAKDGRAKVGDFGLAYPVDAMGSSDASSSALAEPGPRNVSSIAGTPAYMAPEQRLGQPTDARSDQFGFCVALHEALCGSHPFGRQLHEPRGTDRLHPLAPRSGIPWRIHRIIARGLRLSPDERYPTMDLLLTDLARLDALPWSRVVQTAALVAALVGMVGVGAMYARKAHLSPHSADSEVVAAPPPPGAEPIPWTVGAASPPPALAEPESAPAATNVGSLRAPRPQPRASSFAATRHSGAASSSHIDPGSYQ